MDPKNYQYNPGYQQNQQPGYPNMPTMPIQPVQTQPVYYDSNSQMNLTVKPKRNWNFGLFSCFEDLEGLVCAFFCTLCYEYTLFQRAGEGCCDCICAGLVPLRTKIRTERAIEGSLCEDVFAVACCTLCSMVQLSNEMKASPPLV
ncbi:PLAC8 1 [Brachionus plicatilis]|uniref:PLAC8 1 n=1 Tax=Brachionus plicatilis TaxID=10195 RepID=A0A3M7PUZ0_BRAPC|nr:PLAC8 1 [Brachionus plicatilis]